MTSAAVRPEQRFTEKRPCPICGGHARLQKRRGERCWGFLSADRGWAHCTREEFAGPLAEGPDGAFAHRLVGACRCGTTHGASTPTNAATATERVPGGDFVSRREFVIRDADGRAIAAHHRIDRRLPDGRLEKQMWWEPTGVHPADLPLFGLLELLHAPAEHPIVVTEGESACEALVARGVLAVGTVTGAAAIPGDRSLGPLVGRTVFLWPDNDAEGRRHMERIASRLVALGAQEIRIVKWRDAPTKGDAANFGGSDDEIRALIEDAPPWDPSPQDSGSLSDDADFAHTDLGNAELFAHLHGDRVRYDHSRQRWLIFPDEGHQWRTDRDGELARLARATARDRLRQAADVDEKGPRDALVSFARRSESRQRLEAILALAKSEHPIADDGAGWDSDPMLLGVANGIVDLRTGELRPGRPEDRVTLSAGVGYDPNAPCVRWLQFLDEIFQGDVDLTAYVQRAAGYGLTGETTEQTFTLAFGAGSNGKSVLLNMLRKATGEYALNLPFSTFELRDRSSLTPDLAMLPGKRLVTSSETNEGSRLNEARIKALTGGDPVTANPKFGAPFTFMPVAKFLLAVNHLPTVRDDSDAFWRRAHVVPFTRKFAGEDLDKNLEQKLTAELPGILAWMVRGAMEWAQRGLQPPNVVMLRALDWREESDPLGPFIADCCVLAEYARVPAGELFKAYAIWCAEMAIPDRERLSNKKFGQLVAARFHRDDKNWGREYSGIGLRDDRHHELG